MKTMWNSYGQCAGVRPGQSRPARLAGMLLASVLALAVRGAETPPAAGVVRMGAGEAQEARLAAAAEAAGYAVRFLELDALCGQPPLRPQFELLLVPCARELPLESIPSLEAFARQGGRLLALGVPAWQAPRRRAQSRWISAEEYERTLAALAPAKILADFEAAGLRQWRRQSDRPQAPTTVETARDPATGQCLHVTINELAGWDTLAGPLFDQPFAAGQDLTVFRARGGPHTRQLMVEWAEEDGARWIATVDLGPEWKKYVLPPEFFQPWQPPAGRGGPGDRLRVSRARRFTVGLAASHTALAAGRMEYWFDDLGAAANPFGPEEPRPAPAVPRWESFSPAWQTCLARGVATLFTPPGLAMVPPLMQPVPGLAPANPAADLLALHPRPRGGGFGQDRPYRWQPLLLAQAGGAAQSTVPDAASGTFRGALAALVVNLKPPLAGSMWAAFTPDDPGFYEPPAIRELLAQTCRRLRHGVFLEEGGAEFYTAFENQPIRCGARVGNWGGQGFSSGQVRVTVRELAGIPGRADPAAPALARFEWPVALAARAGQSFSSTWQPAAWPAAGCEVITELCADGQVIDRLCQELQVWRPKEHPQYITAQDGAFQLGGRPWKAHGVNYLPSSGIGIAGDYFEYWLDPGAYDPEVIERDLRRIQALNLNAVSAFIYHRSLAAQHLLDFLRRCERLGLRVNLSLRPGTPLDFRWPEMRALIEHYRLARHDTVFAYDLAWEPSHYDHAWQQRYRADWTAWVVHKYGGVAAARNIWAHPPPQAGAASPSPATPLEIPEANLLTRDGPWRRLVADYRLFLDELLQEKYAAARRLVKAIDPHHPVSFRMQFSGDPTLNTPTLLPYDLRGLAGAVDIWEPEAYGRIGDWERIKPGHFTAAYARLCHPGLPLVWAEMGYDCWHATRRETDPEKLQFAAGYYRDFYRLLRASGADGIFFWWYPGGFRLNENSDYGIINPDGTDRPVTRVIREEAARFLAAPKPPAPDQWIEVDRDADARGLPGIYEAVQAGYWSAIQGGHTPGLRWKKTPGTAPPAGD